MSKFVKGMLAATLLLSLTAGTSMASSVSIGISNNTVWEGSSSGSHVIGIGAGVNIPLNQTKQINVDARYEFGTYKEEEDGPPSYEYEEKVSGFRIRVGADHLVQTGMATIYMGSGLSYATHKWDITETGFGDFESESFSVFGVNSRIGVSGPFGEGSNISWFGQVENTFGWGSYEEDDGKITQNENTNGFQGGIMVHFGQNGAN